ncbi:MAG: peptidylprolyl isomerase [Candidatus Neomarinimicrobiota bacterium]
MKKLCIILAGVFLMSCSQDQEVAVISTEFGDMVVEFYEEAAPQHVESFKTLAAEGYFDRTTFHRVIPGFVIQGGDPNSKDDDRLNDGSGGRAGKYFGIGDENNKDTWMIPAEFNDSLHLKGTLSMARTNEKNSATSQFFICSAPVPRLNGKYTVFGKVIKGLDIIDQIVKTSTPRNQNPLYQGPDMDNPLDKIEMTVRLTKRSSILEEK